LTEGETIAYLDRFSEVMTCPNDSVLLTVEGDDNFIWENGDTATQRWVNTTGDYLATFTNEFGFEYLHHFEVSNWFVPEVTAEVFNPLCADGTDGQINLSTDETQFVSYIWSDGEEGMVRTNLMDGEFSCTLTTINGCTVQVQFTLTAPPPIMVQNDLARTICYNTTTSVEPEIAGGIAPYDINWMGADPNDLGEGEHVFEVIDANGCSELFSFAITWSPEIIITLSADTICPGETTSIAFAASGGSGDLTFDFGDIDPGDVGPGIYEIEVVDEQLCFATASIEVAEWSAMVNNIVITPAENGANGGVEIFTSGGTPPYTYLWDNGETLAVLNDLSQGDYNCLVIDSNGCEQNLLAEIIDLVIDEFQIEIRIYPNPFKNELFLRADSPVDFKLTDICGRTVMNGCKVLFSDLNTTELNSGYYFLHLMNGSFYTLVKSN
jgi:hypothetical protein